eukprot:TRINITY_DN13352_c0_g1_i1.p2 TRINITY_DN13352_c0_g1~~TRINITY_DN13352_c0_g1_i1.p2  ORF type:complete len:135 (+),score=12.59 TRINITY_DN13352_c0_g1_i1:262-666(+)
MKKRVPNAKVVLLLREPIDRAFSEWFMKRCTRHGRDAVNVTRFPPGGGDMGANSLYYPLLLPWLEAWSADEIMVMRYSEFVGDVSYWMRKLEEYRHVALHLLDGGVKYAREWLYRRSSPGSVGMRGSQSAGTLL